MIINEHHWDSDINTMGALPYVGRASESIARIGSTPACRSLSRLLHAAQLHGILSCKYSGKRLEVTSLLGEDLSGTSPSGDFTFILIFIDSCTPQPVVVTGINRHRNKNEN
jgi:hypothetical protein